MKILGLDASTAVTGWAVIDSETNELIEYGELALQKFKKKKAPLEFLQVLYGHVQTLLLKHVIGEVYIEDIYVRNPLTVKALARVRGVIEIACLHGGIPMVYELKAGHIRKTVLGKGNLEKADICSILEERYNRPLATKGYDASDAIMVALCGALEKNANSER